MTETTESHGQMLLMLGELRGQMKELIHSVNNSAHLINGLTDKVNKSEGLPDAIKALDLKIAAHDVRLTALEVSENRRAGAITVTGWIIKTVPFASIGAGMFAAWKVMGL